VKALLNDPKLNGLAASILNHGAVNPLSNGKIEGDDFAKHNATNVPAYIKPQQFAAALIDVLESQSSSTTGALKDSIEKISDPQLKQVLHGIYSRADGKIDKVQLDIASWFDASMDRLGGAYKRKTQLWTLCIAYAVAASLNIDTFHLAHVLWIQPELAANAAQVAGSITAANYDAAFAAWSLTFPYGWDGWDESGRSILLMPIGWLATAFAALFGAPFWFDLLQTFVRIRGTGPVPAKPSIS